jgi:hypothetical protein
MPFEKCRASRALPVLLGVMRLLTAVVEAFSDRIVGLRFL